MLIRLLEKGDLPRLSELYSQFWGDVSDISEMEKQLSFIQKEDSHIILVCETDTGICGSVMGVVCRELYGDCRPFLVVENFIVDKSRRRQGIGRALLRELEKLAKERNCSQMILVTEKDRHDACAFYEKNGFQTNNTGYKKKL